MADTSTQSIQVHAPLDRVAAVICDFPSYPQWAEAMKQVEVLSEHADGTRSVVSHFNKAHKGRLARALVASRAEPEDAGRVAAVGISSTRCM